MVAEALLCVREGSNLSEVVMGGVPSSSLLGGERSHRVACGTPTPLEVKPERMSASVCCQYDCYPLRGLFDSPTFTAFTGTECW